MPTVDLTQTVSQPTWKMRHTRTLAGLASLIIAPGVDMGDKHTAVVRNYVNALRISQRTLKTFNSLRLYFGVSINEKTGARSYEATNSAIFSMMKDANLTVVGDSLDTVWNMQFDPDYKGKTEGLYEEYVNTLYDKGVRIFCIDDAHRYLKDENNFDKMVAPLYEHGDTYVLLSGGIPQAAVLQAYATKQASGLELQLYRQGESTIYVDRWVKNLTMEMAALECFRDDSNQLTTIADLKVMANYIARSRVPNISVYGHDRKTNLLSLKEHWKALEQFANSWWNNRATANNPLI